MNSFYFLFFVPQCYLITDKNPNVACNATDPSLLLTDSSVTKAEIEVSRRVIQHYPFSSFQVLRNC